MNRNGRTKRCKVHGLNKSTGVHTRFFCKNWSCEICHDILVTRHVGNACKKTARHPTLWCLWIPNDGTPDHCHSWERTIYQMDKDGIRDCFRILSPCGKWFAVWTPEPLPGSEPMTHKDLIGHFEAIPHISAQNEYGRQWVVCRGAWKLDKPEKDDEEWELTSADADQMQEAVEDYNSTAQGQHEPIDIRRFMASKFGVQYEGCVLTVDECVPQHSALDWILARAKQIADRDAFREAYCQSKSSPSKNHGKRAGHRTASTAYRPPIRGQTPL